MRVDIDGRIRNELGGQRVAAEECRNELEITDRKGGEGQGLPLAKTEGGEMLHQLGGPLSLCSKDGPGEGAPNRRELRPRALHGAEEGEKLDGLDSVGVVDPFGEIAQDARDKGDQQMNRLGAFGRTDDDGGHGERVRRASKAPGGEPRRGHGF